MERTEALAMNHLSVEEVAARRAELRKMRELMFRAEVKAKRIAKIKSKAYRRIQKRAREKDAVGEEGEGEGRMKSEVERAREGATLRHKNTGKWARAMKGKELNVDQRREIEEMLDRGEKLRRKIRGEDEEDESESDDESGDDIQALVTICPSSCEST
jgi:U3 small nucleolar RNA-associated protein 14